MASKRNRKRKDVRLANRSNSAVPKPFRKTGLGKLPPEVREIIFVSLIATPPPYAGHDFAINCAGPKDSPSALKKFVHIKASWYRVTQTCRQIYLESYPLFFASESYYLASPQESSHLLDFGCVSSPLIWGCVPDDVGCRHGLSLHFRCSNITKLCLGGFVTDRSLYTKETIDKILSDPTDYRNAGRTRQQLEAQTVKDVDMIACLRLSQLPNLNIVGLRMRVGEEMEYVNFMYGVSEMRRGLVEFVDQSHWLIRDQHPNDVWRIQYACFSMADHGRDQNKERIPYDRRLIEKQVTDIDSRAPGLQEGDERYVEVQIQRVKRDDEIGTVSEVSDADTEDVFDTRATSPPELSDLDTTQLGELQDIPVTAHDDVEIELGVPPMEMEDDVQISPGDNDLSGTELEQEILNTSEPFVRSQSQDDFDSQSNEHSDQEIDHPLSETASHDVSSIQSTELSHQQAEESLLLPNSTFVWHPVATNTDDSRRFQTYSDDEDSNFQNESRIGDQVPRSTETEETKAERHRRIRIRLLRQGQQPLPRFSNIPYLETAEGMGSFHMLQELADLGVNEQTETGVRESIQSSTSQMREHGIRNPGATSQKATSIGKQPGTAFPEWFWSPVILLPIWTILLTFCYLWLLIMFLTASS